MRIGRETAAQTVSRVIDDLGQPEKMCKLKWIDFLEEVISECESKLDAAKAEAEDADV
jgi:hypothetical protein